MVHKWSLHRATCINLQAVMLGYVYYGGVTIRVYIHVKGQNYKELGLLLLWS